MANTESGELQAYIENVIAATKSGKINWKSINPTTFVWETGPPSNARITLQQVQRTAIKTVPNIVGGVARTRQVQETHISYVFQAFDLRTLNIPIVTIDSSNDPNVNAQLERLFDLVKTGISQRNLDFLKSILPS